jgi:plasmid stabilization system protein ParE
VGSELLPFWRIEGEQSGWKLKMPRGDKSSYTDKQKRQAKHIEDSYRAQGVKEEEAAQRAWATVNKEDHGGKKSGSGRRRKGASSTPHASGG